LKPSSREETVQQLEALSGKREKRMYSCQPFRSIQLNEERKANKDPVYRRRLNIDALRSVLLWICTPIDSMWRVAMKKKLLVVLALIGSPIALPVFSLAQGPTFDCAKAQGEVEKAICSDASLASLDRKLDQAFKAAAAKATHELARTLSAEQRGWIKGRNECWKANGNQTWITATWTVNSVRDCIDAQYRIRTSELQSVWRLLEPKTVSYACQNNPANEVVANFFETDPATIRLERGDRTATLWLVGDTSDGKYEGQNVSVEHKGTQLKVSWLNTDTVRPRSYSAWHGKLCTDGVGVLESGVGEKSGASFLA
jgi:uncharacterized protein